MAIFFRLWIKDEIKILRQNIKHKKHKTQKNVKKGGKERERGRNEMNRRRFKRDFLKKGNNQVVFMCV